MHESLKQLSAWKNVVPVELRGTGITVYVRTWDAHAYGRWTKVVMNAKDDLQSETKLRAIVMACTLCDADGVLMLKSEQEAEQFVRDTAALLVDQIYEAAAELNEIGKDRKKSKNSDGQSSGK